MDENKSETYKIPMLLGFRTETDDKDLHDFMKEMVEADKERFTEMNDSFDHTWPGLRAAVIEATTEIGTKVKWEGMDEDYVEIFDGKVRAHSSTGASKLYCTALAKAKAWRKSFPEGSEGPMPVYRCTKCTYLEYNEWEDIVGDEDFYRCSHPENEQTFKELYAKTNGCPLLPKEPN